MNRIVEQRLSPQYVSVHATDLKTRAYLLGVDEKRADISGKLKNLLDNDIEIHAQVVWCPDINDGAVLEKTLRDLAAHYPRVISTAVVPVALTRYNTDHRLTRVTPEFCRSTIRQVEKLQKEFRRKLGSTFAFLGDEIYIKGGMDIPSRRHYGDYPQIEDGVGMVRTFVDRFERLLHPRETEAQRSVNVRLNAAAMKPQARETGDRLPPTDYGSIITGEMFGPMLKEQIDKFNALTGAQLNVVAVPNLYFGGDVAVAGLLTGQDLIAMRDRVKGDFVVIPKHIIKSDEPILLDGKSYDEVRSVFNVPIYDLDTDGLIRFLFQLKAGRERPAGKTDPSISLNRG
jgi:putative radical SAM enzyme (TIGR03279 family)